MPDPRRDAGKDRRVSVVYGEGWQAYLDGIRLADSPYSDGRVLGWMNGWMDARSAAARHG